MSTSTIAKKNRIVKFTAFDLLLLVIMSLLGIIILYPFYNAVLVSIVPQSEYIRNPLMIIPTKVSFEAYEFVFKSSLLTNSLKNTVFITIVGTVYNMVLTVLLGYAFTKPFPGRKIFRFLIIFTMYFGGGLVPYYLLIKDLNLMNKISVMILPSVITVMYMLIVSSYMGNLPEELEESAKIDGAGDMTILFRIILPLCLPILATFGLYYAVDRWNEWYNAMLFIKSVDKWPLQYTLRKIISDANFAAQSVLPGDVRPSTNSEAVKMASIVVTMFPLMMVYPFLQRFFLTGLTMGAVKG